MSNLYVLEHFNSEFEEYPDYFQPWFEQSYMFAKQMLKDWSDQDIATELESIDRCISGGTPWELPLYFSTKEPLFQPIDGMFGTPTGRAGYAILSNAVQKNVHIDTIGVKSTSWHEIFAVYTIGLLAYAVRDLRYMENNDEFNKEEFIVELCGEYLGETVEAITTASFLGMSSSDPFVRQLIESLGQQKKDIASKGGKAKADKYKPLREKVISLFKEHFEQKKHTNRNAAKRIWECLSDEDKLDSEGNSIISTENAQETLAKWISKYKRTPL